MVPYAYNVQGGVEKVTVSLLRELAELVDRVVFILPLKFHSDFMSVLPPSQKLIYETFEWPSRARTFKRKFLEMLYKNLLRIRKRFPLAIINYAIRNIANQKIELLLNHLISQHGVTHCLYPIINDQEVPRLKVPVTGIVHDIYWHALSSSFTKEYVSEKKKTLKEWLTKSSLIFTVSHAVKDEIIQLFPAYRHKIRAVSNAVDAANINDKYATPSSTSSDGLLIFYYPAHLARPKNHITLLRAILKLAQEGRKFRVILSGTNTQFLLMKTPITYPPEAEECRLLYQENEGLLRDHLEVLGYCNADNVSDAYRRSACVVLTSVYEGFGLPLSEALSRGLPVICSDIPPYREQVSMYQCADRVQFFSPKDTIGLANHIRNFLMTPVKKIDPSLLKERFRYRTWRNIANEYVAALTEVGRK
jgi:glycosyltransferase involved in cell wall biosynthesis